MSRRTLRAKGCLCALVSLAWLGLAPLLAAADPLEVSGSRGQPISIVARDVSMSEIFEMLARKQRVNVLLGKDVTGSVSVNLFDVSLDQAIRAIADAAGYLAERRGGAYVIIDRSEAGKDSAGANTIIRAFKVEYSNPEEVSTIVTKHLSRYGAVTVLANRRLLVVEDLPDFVERIERLLNELDRDPRQILIEAKILEITLNEDEAFGVDWSKTFAVDDGSATIGVKDLALKATPGLFFDLMTSDIEVAITALADDGRVRTLSTPTLLAIEHEEAEVVIGERLGFRVTTTINEVTTESVEFLESGVILKFTASVDRLGRIVLEIHPEVSTGSISADGLPNQTTTEVTTKLVADDGQRIFIAGLIKDTSSDFRTGVPYLRKIPLLGILFSRTQTTDISTETVVVLTARLVEREQTGAPAERAEAVSVAEEAVRERRERLERYFGVATPSGEVDAEEARPQP